ncbi:MAG: hypothetical protein HRU19_28310 [Pseudobacteriovorax sp.]|nr:hypothetical protein [Pseudobacteriovorax sp.]
MRDLNRDLLLGAITAAVLLIPQTSFSEDSEGEEFSYMASLSCATLAELDEATIAAMTHHSNSPDFAEFCVSEDTHICSDYNGLLYNLGTLSTRSGGYCIFTKSQESK